MDTGFSQPLSAQKRLQRHPELLSDLNSADYTAGGECTRGFDGHSAMFNDNIMLTSTFIRGPRETRFGEAASIIRTNLDAQVMRASNEQTELPRLMVTMKNNDAATVLDRLHGTIAALQARELQLDSIDFTIDCKRITTRALVEK